MYYVFHGKTTFFLPVLSFIKKVGRNIVFSINKKQKTMEGYFLFQKRIKWKRKINKKTKSKKRKARNKQTKKKVANTQNECLRLFAAIAVLFIPYINHLKFYVLPQFDSEHGRKNCDSRPL